MTHAAMLASVARRAARDPAFLGFALARWQRRHNASEKRLCKAVGVGPEALAMLRLCRAPRGEEDLRFVCERFGGQWQAMAGIVAEVEHPPED